MTPPGSIDAAAASLAPRGYGARLRAAREQSGLTVDQVAQQLKLAPRQVQAIEDEDLAVLPEVTYIRGFVRNYARLLRIDAGELLDGLPANGTEPAQGATFRRSGTRMAELPPDSASRAGWIRWAIPLLLAIGALVFAGYEWFRQDRERAPATPGSELPATSGTPSTAAMGAPQSQTLAVHPAVVPEGQGGASGAAAGDPSSVPSGAAAGAASAAPAIQAADTAASTPASPGSAIPPAAEATHPARGELRLAFSETAWVEVRDGRGRVLHSETNPSGSTRVITGDPPFALVVGNAAKVRLSFNGRPVDLAEHTQANIARLSLR